MQAISSFFCRLRHGDLGTGGIFTASLTLAYAGVLAAIGLDRLFSARLTPAPVTVKVRASRRDMRVWNDGKDTISIFDLQGRRP